MSAVDAGIAAPPALDQAIDAADFAYSEGEFKNKNGYRIFNVAYRPRGRPTAVLLFHHGYGEHVGRYKYAFRRIASAGVAVFAHDCQSFGQSEPQDMKALVWSIDDLVDDQLQFYEQVRAEYGPDMPFFIGGQSMGGLASMLTVLRDQSRWSGIVLCSPAVDIEWTWIYRLQIVVGQLLVWLCPTARLIPSLPIEGISQDPEVIKDALADPLNVLGPLRVATGWAIVTGTRNLEPRMHEVTLPMYAHHGTQDCLTSIQAVKKLYAAAQSTDTTLFEVQGGYHELLIGPEKEEVTQHIVEWVLAQAQKQADKPAAA